MDAMRLDHLSFAAGPDGLDATADRIGALLGCDVPRRRHPPALRHAQHAPCALADGTYLEIVEALDHPASDKAPFGQAVKARSALGGGWLGWVVSVDDISRRRGRGSAARRSRATGTAPTAPSCAGSRSASTACSPTRSCPSSSSGRPRPSCTRRPAPTARSPWPAWRSPATRTA